MARGTVFLQVSLKWYEVRISYCTRKYGHRDICKTPVLREDEIKEAFESVLKTLGNKNVAYSEDIWRELVESVTVYNDRHLEFQLTTGNRVNIGPNTQ